MRSAAADAPAPVGGTTIATVTRNANGSQTVVLRGSWSWPIRPGDCVVIPPGTVHRLWAHPAAPLVVVCSCVPPYSHEDTVLVD